MPWTLLLNPRILGTILAVAVLTGTHLYAYTSGKQTERKEWELAQAQITKNQLEAMEAERVENQRLTSELNKEKARADANYRSYKDAISKVTDGRVCFTPDAWGLWITSLTGEKNLPPTTGQLSGTGKGASDTEVLGNAVENFERYKDCRTKLNRLIDWHKTH